AGSPRAAHDARIRALADAGCGADARRGEDGDRQGLRRFETRAGRRVGRNGQDCGSDPQGDSNFSSEGQETMNRPDCADAFETKSADAADDLAGAFEEFMTSFEAFKE